MITLTSTGIVTIRGRNVGLNEGNRVITDLHIVGIIEDAYRDDVGPISFYVYHHLRDKKVTTPVLYELIKNTVYNILIEYKDKWYIVGKNLILGYDIETDKIQPLMIHIVKKKAKTLREGKIVFHPSFFDIDSSFKKLFEIVVQTGVDIEVTKFIEEKYTFRPNLPKFGTLSSMNAYVMSASKWLLEQALKQDSL